MPCNEADAVRSAKTMYILGSKTKNDHRRFFMNRSGKAISQERKS